MNQSSVTVQAELVIRNGTLFTMDPARPWARALAVRGGRITAVGDGDEIGDLIGPGTRVVDVGGRMVLPGLADVHAHVGFGGQSAAWELPLSPTLSVEEILGSVRDLARRQGPDEWVVGGPVISPVFYQMGTPEMLAALDEVSSGRPVMLRDDSLHNRWVNSRALRIMGVDRTTPDPAGGSYVRDADGRPTGLLLGQPSTDAELAVRRSVGDVRARDLRSARSAVSILNSVGITAVQDAATMGVWLDVFSTLDRDDKLDAWIVGSMPAREFVESGLVGPELYDAVAGYRTEHVRPDFVKGVLDGVPMTRTAKFLEPYKPDAWRPAGGHQCPFHGDGLFSDEQLKTLLDDALSRGLHVKLHATADGTVRQALDAVQWARDRYDDRAVFHIAHPEFVHPDDIARFRPLGVVADASPVLWFPNPMNEIIAAQVQDHYMDRVWPLRELTEAGALVAAGSDWPVAMTLPNPWLSIETMVTRRSPDPAFPGTLAADQAISLELALEAHTVNAAFAMGLGLETGRLAAGMSADFIVLDRHLFQIAPEQIHETRVEQTWFGGKLVHEG